MTSMSSSTEGPAATPVKVLSTSKKGAGNPSPTSTKKDLRIVEPREVDVLCGRGGMSNHHPGNEWYRRLIRSNRPLYRACPKHTKLLVAKAIVQAVEQKNGRFLERNKKTNSWHIVSSKRSVDKTSQGLRERDKDNASEGEDNDSTSEASNSSVEDHAVVNRKSKVTKKKFDNTDDSSGDESKNDDLDEDRIEEHKGEVPFQRKQRKNGKGAPPNLMVLAMESSKKGNSKKKSSHPDIKKNEVLEKKKRRNEPGSESSPKQLPKRAKADDTYPETFTNNCATKHEAMNQSAPPLSANVIQMQLRQHQQWVYLQQLQQRQQLQKEEDIRLQMQQSHSGISTGLPGNGFKPPELYAAESTVSTLSLLDPLPPSIQLRDSSMYHLLKYTKMLPQQSAHADLSVTENIDMNHQIFMQQQAHNYDQKYQYDEILNQIKNNQRNAMLGAHDSMQRQHPPSNQFQLEQHQTHLRRLQDLRNQLYNFPNSDAMLTDSRHGNVSNLESTFRTTNDVNIAVAPSLTRMSTQVSDWLRNSFWPLSGTASSTPAVDPSTSSHNSRAVAGSSLNQGSATFRDKQNSNHEKMYTSNGCSSNAGNELGASVSGKNLIDSESTPSHGLDDRSRNTENLNIKSPACTPAALSNTKKKMTNQPSSLSQSCNDDGINSQVEMYRKAIQALKQSQEDCEMQQVKQHLLQQQIRRLEEIQSQEAANNFSSRHLLQNAILERVTSSGRSDDDVLAKQNLHEANKSNSSYGTTPYCNSYTQEAGATPSPYRITDVHAHSANHGSRLMEKRFGKNNATVGEDDSDDPLMDGDMKDDHVLSRTELEQNVSTTMLQMAGVAPSLLSGLTSFFERRGTSSKLISPSDIEQINETNDSNAPSSSPSRDLYSTEETNFPQSQSSLPRCTDSQNSGVVGTNVKRSKLSLLDDYEESPMEARLRLTVPWK